jgi:hypothetical protein
VDFSFDPSQQGHAVAEPGAAAARVGEHELGSRAVEGPGGGDQERTVLAGGGASEADPDAGVDAAAACDRRQTQVDGDQRESAGDRNLCGGRGLAQMTWADPQHSLEIDACGARQLGVEPVAEVDQCRVLTTRGRRCQAGEHGGEASTADVAADFGQGSVGKSPAEQPIELAAPGCQVVATLGVELIGTPEGVAKICRESRMQRCESG